MINELFGQAILGWFIGTLTGIVLVWNEKVFYTLFIIGLVAVIVGILILGNPYSAEYPWWRTIFGVVFMFLGIQCGRVIGRAIFKK